MDEITIIGSHGKGQKSKEQSKRVYAEKVTNSSPVLGDILW